MNIEVPEYVRSKDSYNNFAFNVSWYTNSINNIALTLLNAKKYFVQLSGYNIISAYCYFKNSIYSISSIATTYFSSQKIATKKLVCDEILCNKIENRNEKQINKTTYFYFNGMSIPINNIKELTKTSIEGLIIPNTFNMMIPPNHIKCIWYY